MLTAMRQAASSLTDSILLRTLGLIAALVIACTWIAARVLPGLAANRDRLDALAPGPTPDMFDDWLFPSSEFVTPIYDATAEFIARHAAIDLDREWAELNGGWSA